MDLLAPWKRCLQCLPVFASEPLPPPPPPASKAPPVHAAALEKSKPHMGAPASAKNSSERDPQGPEKPSFSDASLTHDPQNHDLPLSDFANDVGPLDYIPAETNFVTNDGEAGHVDHDNDSAQAPQDVASTTTGPMLPLSTHTPTPVGLASILGQQRPSHHTHHQPTHAQNDGFHASSHPQSITSHVQGLQTTSTLEPLMEKSHSTPVHIDEPASGPHGAYKHEDMAMYGSSTSSLETSQTEPNLGVGRPRVRRRDQLKHQFKDLRSQLKQGGSQLKQEGSKHLQSMRSVLNKQAQQK